MANWITYTMPEHKSGDYFEGVQFDIAVNGTPLNLAGATIEMILPASVSAPLTSATSAIEISTSTTGRFTIMPQIISLRAGHHEYRIRITLANGRIKTYVRGTWNIT